MDLMYKKTILLNIFEVKATLNIVQKHYKKTVSNDK